MGTNVEYRIMPSGEKRWVLGSYQGWPTKLLRAGCETRSVYDFRKCKDTVVANDSSEGAVIKPRTDSAAMALLAKKKERRQSERSDRGFIR